MKASNLRKIGVFSAGASLLMVGAGVIDAKTSGSDKCLVGIEQSIGQFNAMLMNRGSNEPRAFVLGYNEKTDKLVVGLDTNAEYTDSSDLASIRHCTDTMCW